MAAMWSPIIGLFLLLLLLPLEPSSSSHVKFPLQGNVYPLGHFYVTMNIGVPPKPYYLDVDTGSNLTWLECDHPCLSCNRVPHPLYKPTQNNLKVPCGHQCCNALREDVGGQNPECTRQDPHQCHYSIRYVDGTSEGVLANDKFSFQGLNGLKNFVFGCGFNQQPAKPSPVDGILGLGMGKVGFVAHLKSHKMITKNVIGHCMSMKGGGYLFIGDMKFAPSASITWVPMTKSGHYYSAGKATLLFDGQLMSSNGVEVVFDSGATYTYMPAQIYHDIVSKVKATLSSSLTEVHDPALTLCWKGREPFKSVDNVKKEFKPLSLRFANDKIMVIPPENHLVVTNLGNVCLGILDGSSEPGLDALNLILIGDVTMQDLFVIYDNDSGRLGWVRAPCNRLRESESVISPRL